MGSKYGISAIFFSKDTQIAVGIIMTWFIDNKYFWLMAEVERWIEFNSIELYSNQKYN